MIKIPQADLRILNTNFQKFRTACIKRQNNDRNYFVSQLNRFEKKYKQAGLENNFAETLFSFAQQMRKYEIKDFPGIIYSIIVKMPFITLERKETFALSALEFAHEQGDSIHALARIVDLKILYKQSKQNHKYNKMLFQEEKELQKICSDFSNAKENFRTHSKEHNSLNRYQLQLAKTRVDMSKVLLKLDPKRAKKLLKKARITFELQARQKEVEFVDAMLLEIEK